MITLDSFIGKVVHMSYLNPEYFANSKVNDFYVFEGFFTESTYFIIRHNIQHSREAPNGYGYRETDFMIVPVNSVELHTTFEDPEKYIQPEKYYLYDDDSYRSLEGLYAAILRENYNIQVLSDDMSTLIRTGKDKFRGREISVDELKQYYTEGVIE